MSPNPYQKQYEIAGADIEQVKLKVCGKCKAPILLGLVSNPRTKTLKWQNLSRQPVERSGLRYYLRHACYR